ncbi:MAG: hypothetical protein HY007_03215 [Candidatus Sungbacteria bacterium]|nr:hypothetical protein [Candidatus Sungbacteria bacterium]
MTALAYAYEHIASRMAFGNTGAVRSFQFARINQKSTVTYCLIGLMALGAIQYLGALYSIFSFGLRLQSENRQISRLSGDVDALELNVQRISANFPVEHKEQLDSMEKISQVLYLRQDQKVVSYVSSL